MSKNITRKKDKGPKYHRWNEAKQDYVLLKPYQLVKDPDNPGFRLMPIGMRKIMTDEEFTKYGNITIYDNKKNKTRKIRPKTIIDSLLEINPIEIPEPVQNPNPNITVKIIKRKPKVVIVEAPPVAEEEKSPVVEEEEKSPVVEEEEKSPVEEEEKSPVVEEEEKSPVEEEEKSPVEEEEKSPVVEEPSQEYTANTTYDFLYPELDDPEFNIKLAKHKEFSDTKYDGKIHDIKSQSDFLCKSDFELMPHQNFVKNFLSLQTPYNSLLLYHGLGSGKTCSAIGVAEEMRNYMKQIGIKKHILIVASPNVQDNFRLQLFDERKLKFENGVWNINTCVGNSLLHEINPTFFNDMTRENIINQIKILIKNAYIFMGYTQFANYINEVTEVKGIGYSKEQKEEIKIKKIKHVFNNQLIIIDEAHNIRITTENKNKKAAELLMNVVKHADNMRLLLLSATPMYNSYEEIIWLTNLMNLNDKRGTIKISDVFDKNGGFKENGEDLLRRKLTGYISYVRGENPYSFPFRVYKESDITDYKYPSLQMNGKLIDAEKQIKHIPVYLNEIGEYQKIGYKFIINNMRKRSHNIYTKMGEEREMPDFENMDSFGYALLQIPLEALNIVYPNDELAEKKYEIEEELNIISSITGSKGLSRIMKYKEIKSDNPLRYNYQYISDTHGRIFSRENLHKYSAKMANICEIIRKSEGIVLIYSQYIDGGIIPMALALEEMGFTRYGSESYTRSLFKEAPMEPVDANTLLPKGLHTSDTFNPAKYVIITGDKTFSPNNDADIKYINSVENKNGEKVKVVLISKAAGEGVDFKNIRQVHVMEPWYNMNRLEQIIGRGVRNLSHCQLPFEKRNVEIFLHATIIDDVEESTDLYIYRLAEQKSIKIGRVTRLIKENAVDCILNSEQSNFTRENFENQEIQLQLSTGEIINYKAGDRPSSDICDYMDCNLVCKPNATISEDDVVKSTYNNDFAQMNNPQIIRRIKELFKDIPGQSVGKHFFKREELINSINIVKQYPIEQIYSALSYLIQNKNEYLIDRYGRLGNLINRGEYYFFQPVEITDENASIYERSVPVDFKHSSILFELPKDKKIVEIAPQESNSFDIIMDKLNNNYTIATSDKIEITSGEKNWYKNFNVVREHLIKDHEISDEKLKKHLVYHMLDELPFLDKYTIMNKIYNQWTPVNTLETYTKDYFNEHIVVAENGSSGLVLSDDNITAKIYIQKNERWELSEFVENNIILRSKEYSSKNIFNKQKLNQIIGFMSWNEKEKEYVFKTRDLSDSVNKIGARVSQALMKDIIIKINTILDEPYYTNDNVKDYVGEGKNKLVIIIEIFMREFQDENVDNKIWFLTNEQMLINKIPEYKRKN